MSKCPICNPNEHGKLCRECEAIRFFDDDKKEVRYRLRTLMYATKLKEEYGDDYKPEFHTDSIRQLVQCEIQIEYYAGLIANNKETPTIIELLRSERVHWRNVADKLQITVRSIRGDTKNVKIDASTDFTEYMIRMLNAKPTKDKEE